MTSTNMTSIQLSDGHTLAVHDSGTGPVVLFVHGFPLDHSMWLGQLDEFSRDHRVIAPDLRGFGNSGFTDGTVSMSQFASDLIELLDALQVTEPVVLCGLSMGGYIAFRCLDQFAPRFKATILCDTRAGEDSPEGVRNRLRVAEIVSEKGPAAIADGMMEKLFAPQTFDRQPQVVEATRQVVLDAPASSVAAASRGMAARPDSSHLLPSITMPTLWICGVHDAITTADEMKTAAAQTPDARFEPISDAGHMAPLERPAAVNAVIRDFLKSVG